MIDRDSEMAEDRRIRFRVGINLGDIIADGDDIFGDGVNIAARLEALAQPGGICISRVVRDQIRDKLPYAFQDRGGAGRQKHREAGARLCDECRCRSGVASGRNRSTTGFGAAGHSRTDCRHGRGRDSRLAGSADRKAIELLSGREHERCG